MQTHSNTPLPKAEPFYRTIGTYVQVDVPFAQDHRVWLIGTIIDCVGDVVTVRVRGAKCGVDVKIDTANDLRRIKPFVIA